MCQVNIQVILRQRAKIIIPYLMFITLIKFDSLINYEDMESNPGPTYHIQKVILGSFHQGDNRFGNTVQCACNSLYALFWSQIKKVYQWNRLDLDHVLTEEDNFHRNFKTFDMLSVKE